MAAKKKVAPKKVLAAYPPPPAYPREICPLCFSRPSVQGRIDKSDSRGERGWTTYCEEIKVRGKAVSLYVTRYPCSNPECNTTITTYSDLSRVKDLPWIVDGFLPKNKWATFFSGGWDERGVWRPDEALAVQRELRDEKQLGGEGAFSPTPPSIPKGKRSRKRQVSPDLALLEADIKDQIEIPNTPPPTVESRLEDGVLHVRYHEVVPGFRRNKEGWVKVDYGTDRYQIMWEFFFDKGIEIP
jgi:hypothetical protein